MQVQCFHCRNVMVVPDQAIHTGGTFACPTCGASNVIGRAAPAGAHNNNSGMDPRVFIVAGGSAVGCAVAYAYGWLGIVAGVAIAAWGIVALAKKKRTVLSMMFEKRSAGFGVLTIALGLLFGTCGVMRVQNDAAEAERERIAREAEAERQRKLEEAHQARVAEIENQLPQKIAQWKTKIGQANAKADASDFDPALASIRSIEGEMQAFLDDLEPDEVPPDLAEMAEVTSATAKHLEARSDLALAVAGVGPALDAAEKASKHRNWYEADRLHKEAAALLARITGAEGDLADDIPDDLDLEQIQKELDALEPRITEHAVPPEDLTVRQYLRAPEKIQAEAVALRWDANAAQIKGLSKLVKDAGVKDDALAGIKHCADGIMKKDRKVLKAYDGLVQGIRAFAKPNEPASNAIDICLATLAALALEPNKQPAPKKRQIKHEARPRKARPQPAARPHQRTCCKVCRKGKPCGDSCISRSKTCHRGAGCAC